MNRVESKMYELELMSTILRGLTARIEEFGYTWQSNPETGKYEKVAVEVTDDDKERIEIINNLITKLDKLV